MWVYWGMFAGPAIASLAFSGRDQFTLGMKWTWWSFGILFVLVIGLRFEVGMDWGNYLGHLYLAQDLRVAEIFSELEPAYWLLNWVASRLGVGVWLVNLVCAAIFVSGLMAFCRQLPSPWIGLLVSIPYLAIVVSMNYTRQGVAIGIILWALVALQEERLRRFVLLVVLAALFHKTAVILLPLGILASSRNRYWSTFWIVIASIVAYLTLLAEAEENLREIYILEQYGSAGAEVRVLMNAVGGIACIAAILRSEYPSAIRQLWLRLSLVTLVFIPAVYLSPSTTAVDRVALYFMPIQIVGWSYWVASARSERGRQMAVLAVLGGYAAVEYVWFTYAVFSWAWIPYKFYPLQAM